MSSKFLNGLELSQFFFEEAILPLINDKYPSLPFDAALIGQGSEILGYDDLVSTDHHWGPRCQLFLSDKDLTLYQDEMSIMLSENLPYTFRGYSTNWSEPDPTDGNTQMLRLIDSGSVNHRIEITSVDRFLYNNLAISSTKLSELDWLLIPEQNLLEFTSGKVFYNGLGELTKARNQLSYFPKDVWIFKMLSEWDHIAEEVAFVGRTGSIGDDLGSRIEAARLVRRIIRLFFLLNQKYIPYSKWITTAFNQIDGAQKLSILLQKILTSENWREREELLCKAYLLLLDKQNSLKIAPPIHLNPQRYHTRDQSVIDIGAVCESLKKLLNPPLSEIKYPIGSIDQFVDDTHILCDPHIAKGLHLIYKKC